MYMETLIGFAVRLLRAGKRIYEKKGSFFGVFAFIFLTSVVMLGKADLLPNASPTSVRADSDAVLTEGVRPAAAVSELPTKIEISAIGLSASIANPTTTDIEVLDQKLLAGAVRYPTSAKLGEKGNVVLFGHSSYLPVVGNQAYKTFNGIQKLSAGDIVTVSSSGTAYTYRVRDVVKESAAGNAGIELAVSGRVLTLATCNSFGKKTDRFVVTADFVESHAISG